MVETNLCEDASTLIAESSKSQSSYSTESQIENFEKKHIQMEVHQATIVEISDEDFYDAVSLRSEHSVYFDPRKYSEIEPPYPVINIPHNSSILPETRLNRGNVLFLPDEPVSHENVTIKDLNKPWEWPPPLEVAKNTHYSNSTDYRNDPSQDKEKSPGIFFVKLEHLESSEFPVSTDVQTISESCSNDVNSIDKVNRWLDGSAVVVSDIPDAESLKENKEDTCCERVRSLASQFATESVKLGFCVFIVIALSFSVCIVIYLYSTDL